MGEIPSKLSEELSFGEIHRQFSESDYGRALSEEIRFDRYRPDHTSKEEWVEMLGADVNNLEHMSVTYGIARQFLRLQEPDKSSLSISFNPDEEKTIMLAALINDWHEAITGDINYELKTEEDERDEQTAFNQIFDEFFDTSQPENKNLKLVVERTIFDRNTKLGEAFNAIERVGYMRTCLRAYSISRETEDETLKNHLEWLSAGVLSNQIPALLEYEDQYPFIKKYLDDNQESIAEAYDVLSDDIFPRHGQKERVKQEAYNFSKNTWHNRGNASKAGAITREAYDKGVFGPGPNFEKRFIPSYEELGRQVEACRTLGLKVVLTSGSFDIKHVGHERYLYMAHTYGDILVVGVDSDEKIQQRKGKHRPVNPETERLESLVHLRYVDFVTLKRHDEPQWHLIKTVRPDTLILTQETYDKADIDALKEYCREVQVLPPQATTSTSAKIGRFLKEHNQTLNGELEEVVDEWIEDGVVDEATARKMGKQLMELYERLIADA